MKVLSYISDLQNALLKDNVIGKKIAFVPTMGNLHEGHLSLVQRAKQEADIVVVSIFVNPLQFGANEDLDSYPRTLEEDINKLTAEGAHYLFTPVVKEIYPEGMLAHSVVSVPEITQHHCGASRPGHFDGVSTIVTKLFNIVQPDVAIFGEKDFQQLAVIRKMANDLCIPVEIIGAATARASDGLALSSRNQYLNDAERQTAPQLYKQLQAMKASLLEDISKRQDICREATEALASAGFKVDYLNICDAYSLEDLNDKSREAVILIAAFLGKTRLIDNISFPLNTEVI